MPSPHLRVTARCLEEDLGFSPIEAKQRARLDARSFTSAHDAVERFVTMRADEPDKGKAIHGIRPRGKVCSLRVGTGRAVSTWDEEEDVCWLLAYDGFHQNGHPDDAYKVFLELHMNGDRLLPSVADYELFFETTADDDDDYEAVMALGVLDELAAVSARLLEEARSHPLKEAVSTYRVNGQQIMCVDMLVEGDTRAEVGWMGLRLPEDEHLSDSDVYDMLSALLPADVLPIYDLKFRDRERLPGEIVYRWECIGE